MSGEALEERAVAGLHDFLVTNVVARHVPVPGRALDLGGGSGALGHRLHELGFDVQVVDVAREPFGADLPFQQVDLDERDFATAIEPGSYDLVTAVEVIEHLESPIGFLRNVARLLRPGGCAIVTTPNVENLHARVKYLLTGTLRLLDRYGDPTHISPVVLDLLERQYLPRAELVLVEATTYPPGGFRAGRRLYRLLTLPLLPVLKGSLVGDNHVLVLRRR